MAGQFWSSPNMEPKQNFRFIMSVADIIFYLVKSTGRPNFEISNATHDYLNHEFKFPAKVSWQDIDVTLVDPIDDNSSEKMKQIISDSGYQWINPDANLSFTNLNTISKRRAVEAMSLGSRKSVVLDMIDAEGRVVDRWTLQNAWISNVKPSDVAYDNEDLSDLTLTIKYDFAKLETFNPPVGG